VKLNGFPKRLRIWFKSLHFGRSSVDSRYALVEACVIGILSALAALLLKNGVGWLGGWRIQIADRYGSLVILPAVGLTLGLLSGWILQTFSPAAAGGGIPQVKAALARYPIPLSLQVALAKIIGTTLILGAGFTLGRRAPTVHIGAALAAQLSSWLPTSPEHRRQMIAAGAAAGLAAGFNTPIAGVLFVVEELMRDISGLTLETAIVASFTGAVVSRLLDSAGLNLPPSLLQERLSSFSAPEIPFYLLLGALAGVLGALFNRAMLFSFWVNRRVGLPLALRIGLVGLLSGTIIAFLPPFFQDNSGLREFLVYGGLSWQNIAIALIAHFVLTILAYSTSAPGGLFAPALVMGSALGYLVGDLAAWLSGVNAESTYALAGMGAFFTAVGRIPVTAIVIVFEITTDFNIVLPLMVTCAVAYIVAESISSGSIYEHLLKTSGIEVKPEEIRRDDFLNKLTAADVMQSSVETLESNLTLDAVMIAISKSHHRGFPVIEAGKLVGIITQSDLASLNLRSPETLLKEIMTPRPITVKANTALSDVLYLLNRYQLSRLPVTESNKLVGIITRTDIIRSEVKQLNEGTQRAVKTSPSYVVYQTRSPAIGKGRILLPIANPQTAPALIKIAAAIARYHNYELECLQIIKVAKHTFPSEVYVNTQESRKLLHKVERLGRQWNIPVHTQIRVAQDRAEAILEAIAERQIKILMMGWKGNTTTPGAIFGDLVDTVISRATCDLMLVKLGISPNAFPNDLDTQATWLIPMAGGPNAQRAIELMPSLVSLYARPQSPKLWLCQVYSPTTTELDCSLIERSTQYLRDSLSLPAMPIAVRSKSVSEALIKIARQENCNVVMLGASREGLLQKAIYGNIPEAIANGVNSTVILVRGAS
jgi:chloride channel protein, CIC family